MRMGKKKLKFKFLFVFLFSVVTLGLVSFNTFAFTTNASANDSVIGFTIENFVYEEVDTKKTLVEFSNGNFIWVDNVGERIVLTYTDEFNFEEDVIQDLSVNPTYFFDDDVTILGIYPNIYGSFNIEFYDERPTLINGIFSVFSNIGSVLMVLINGLIVIFYANNQLTFLGILALCGLGIAIILLILNIIQNFLHFKG